MSETQITTGKVRFSYCNLFEPQDTPDGKQKYGVTLLISKNDEYTIAKINKAIEAAKDYYSQKHKGGKALPAKPKLTLHDGDGERPTGGEFGPECKGCYVITVSSKKKPVIIDADKSPITDERDLYSGCYGRAVINFYVYDTNGNRGITAGLNGVMKLQDGEPLGGGVITDSDWDDGWKDDDAAIDLLG